MVFCIRIRVSPPMECSSPPMAGSPVTGALVGEAVRGIFVGDSVTGAFVGDVVTGTFVGDVVMGTFVGDPAGTTVMGASVGDIVTGAHTFRFTIFQFSQKMVNAWHIRPYIIIDFPNNPRFLI